MCCIELFAGAGGLSRSLEGLKAICNHVSMVIRCTSSHALLHVIHVIIEKAIGEALFKAMPEVITLSRIYSQNFVRRINAIRITRAYYAKQRGVCYTTIYLDPLFQSLRTQDNLNRTIRMKPMCIDMILKTIMVCMFERIKRRGRVYQYVNNISMAVIQLSHTMVRNGGLHCAFGIEV